MSTLRWVMWPSSSKPSVPHSPGIVPSSTSVTSGEITEPLRDGNLIGNGPKVLADIDMLANDFSMGSPGTCGKDGQGVPVGDGQPTLRVKSMTVGGTA